MAFSTNSKPEILFHYVLLNLDSSYVLPTLLSYCVILNSWLTFILKKFVQETNENLEDASSELILTDEDIVRFQIGEVFAHVPKDEVENRIEQMKEVTEKNLEKLTEEKESIVSQMAELKKVLYGKFKDSINLEED